MTTSRIKLLEDEIENLRNDAGARMAELHEENQRLVNRIYALEDAAERLAAELSKRP
jgi:hypothetical protein